MSRVILFTLFFSACSKEQADKGPYYQQFVGTWKSVGSSEREEIQVKPNGVIKIYYELDRIKKMKVESWYKIDTLQIAGNTWAGAGFKGKYKTSITLRLDSTGDSLICSSSAPLIIDGQLDKPQLRKRYIKAS